MTSALPSLQECLMDPLAERKTLPAPPVAIKTITFRAVKQSAAVCSSSAELGGQLASKPVVSIGNKLEIQREPLGRRG